MAQCSDEKAAIANLKKRVINSLYGERSYAPRIRKFRVVNGAWLGDMYTYEKVICEAVYSYKHWRTGQKVTEVYNCVYDGNLKMDCIEETAN